VQFRSVANPQFSASYVLSPLIFGLTISSSIWGTVCGSILAGRLADKSDRPNLVGSCSILYAIAAIGITLPVPREWLFVLAMR
jgi:MFS family permease